jgi:hypothetical protein
MAIDTSWHGRLRELIGEDSSKEAIEEFTGEVANMVLAGADPAYDKIMALYQISIIYLISKKLAQGYNVAHVEAMAQELMLDYFNDPALAVCKLVSTVYGKLAAEHSKVIVGK